MPAYTLSLEHNPPPEAISNLHDQLDNFNIQTTGIGWEGMVAVFARDEQGQMIGGIDGWAWGDGFEVDYLWVHADWRGYGIGSQLMQAIEQEAIARHCRQIMLETYTFQAPDFYQKLGFEIVGKVENFPTPYTHYLLRKRLPEPS